MLEMKLFGRLLLAGSLLVVAASTSRATDDDYLTYAEFIAAVEAGSVKSVSVDQFSSISGSRTIGGQDRPFRSYAATGSANDVLLMRLLNQQGVEIKNSPDNHSDLNTATLITGLLMVGIPIVTLLIIIRVSVKLSRVRKEVAALNKLLSEDFHDGDSGY